MSVIAFEPGDVLHLRPENSQEHVFFQIHLQIHRHFRVMYYGESIACHPVINLTLGAGRLWIEWRILCRCLPNECICIYAEPAHLESKTTKSHVSTSAKWLSYNLIQPLIAVVISYLTG